MVITEGELIVLEAEFRRDGVLVDPSTPVVCYVKKRGVGETRSATTASSESTGVYTITYTPAEAGKYDYQFKSADNAIVEGDFYARNERTS